MSQNPALQTYLPATFAERGAYVPFTTPALVGARARMTGRDGLSLVVQNPSGGRGAYILPWRNIREFCCPTVHDRRLAGRVAALASIAPGTIRGAARAVALEGLAGREASDAAAMAVFADEQAREATLAVLLQSLVQQVEAGAPVPPEPLAGTVLEQRAAAAMCCLAPKLGVGADEITAGIEALAELFAPLGLGGDTARARIPAAISGVQRLRQSVSNFAAAGDTDATTAMAAIVESVDLVTACAGPTLVEACGLSHRLFDLLATWRREPAAVTARTGRVEWLMDGWGQVCAQWEIAEGWTDRRHALGALRELLPIIPSEVGEWAGSPVAIDAQARPTNRVMPREDWRSGLDVSDRIAKAEQMRALAA